jgi:hypothetical protein
MGRVGQAFAMSARRPRALRAVPAPAGSPYPKCSLVLRGLARVVDIAVAVALYRLGGAAGAVLALLYLSLADGLFLGQSLGKRSFGIRAVYLPSRSPVRYRDSVLRNAPLTLIVLLGMMPSPLGGAAFIAGVVVVGGIEAQRALRDPEGFRLGDLWAQTQVIDAKVLAGAQGEIPPAPLVRAPGRLLSAARSGPSRRARRSPWCESP